MTKERSGNDIINDFNLKIQNRAIQIPLVWVQFRQNISSSVRRDFATT